MFDFSQTRWQADCRELSNDEKDAFLMALEKAFPDLRWAHGEWPTENRFYYNILFKKHTRRPNGLTQGISMCDDIKYTATASDVREFIAAANKPADTGPEIDPKPQHTGNKYHRNIRDIKGRLCMVLNAETGNYEPAFVDFYSIEQACALPGGGITHCAKKVLFCGIRGKGDSLQDLIEARDALTRAIDGLKGEMESNGVQK